MANQNPLISVIVAVYKAEEYLEQCFDSILSQTYTNLEIILVDDGSPGDSPRICDEYAQKDSRIIVIHKPNGGHSDARNAGLDIAKGDYITFVDCDDWIEPDMMAFLYNHLTSYDVDISCSGAYKSYVNRNIPYEDSNAGEPLVIINEKAASMALTLQINHSATAKLYKKSIFDELRYPVGKTYDDIWVIADVFMAAEMILVDYTPKYYYRKRKSSIVNSIGKRKKIEQKLEALEERQRKITEKYPGLVQIGEAVLYSEYMRIVRSVLYDNDYSISSELGAVMLSILSKIKMNISHLLKNAYISKREKVLLCFLKISKRLYIQILLSSRPHQKHQSATESTDKIPFS